MAHGGAGVSHFVKGEGWRRGIFSGGSHCAEDGIVQVILVDWDDDLASPCLQM